MLLIITVSQPETDPEVQPPLGISLLSAYAGATILLRAMLAAPHVVLPCLQISRG